MANPDNPVRTQQRTGGMNARRKLIRGAFALPALAAVHSGSALANSSSLRCLRNRTYQSVPATLNDSQVLLESPKYQRIKLAVAVKQVHGQPIKYRWYVEGDSVHAIAGNLGLSNLPPTFINRGEFMRFDHETNKVTGVAVTRADVESNSFVLSTPVDQTKRLNAVLMFDVEGKKILGVGDSGATGYAATASCWTSFGTNPG